METVFGKNVKRYRDTVIRSSVIADNVIVGDDAFITDSRIGLNCTIERRGMIMMSRIGDYSNTGYNTVIKYADIGKFCSVSWNVSIGGAEHDYKSLTTHAFPFKSKYNISDDDRPYDSMSTELVIGNDVWIGSNACIMRGVHVGDGAVIGAGSIVTKDVPAYAIVYGNPAQVHNYRFDRQIIDRLLKIKWWNWPQQQLRDHLYLFQGEFTEEKMIQMEQLSESYCNMK